MSSRTGTSKTPTPKQGFFGHIKGDLSGMTHQYLTDLVQSRGRTLTRTAKQVLMLLLGKGGNVTISAAEISEELGISQRTVDRGMRDLRVRGYIKVTHNRNELGMKTANTVEVL